MKRKIKYIAAAVIVLAVLAAVYIVRERDKDTRFYMERHFSDREAYERIADALITFFADNEGYSELSLYPSEEAENGITIITAGIPRIIQNRIWHLRFRMRPAP